MCFLPRYLYIRSALVMESAPCYTWAVFSIVLSPSQWVTHLNGHLAQKVWPLVVVKSLWLRLPSSMCSSTLKAQCSTMKKRRPTTTWSPQLEPFRRSRSRQTPSSSDQTSPMKNRRASSTRCNRACQPPLSPTSRLTKKDMGRRIGLSPSCL